MLSATDTTNGWYLTRMLNCATLTPTNLTGNTALCGSVTPFGTNAWNVMSTAPPILLSSIGINATNSQTFDASLVRSHQLLPWGVVAPIYYNILGDVSSLADMYYTTTGFGSFGDELTVGGNIYIIWPLTNNSRMAVRKG
jgi:hypothetical protein